MFVRRKTCFFAGNYVCSPDTILFPKIQRFFSARTKVLYFLIGAQYNCGLGQFKVQGRVAGIINQRQFDLRIESALAIIPLINNPAA
jgi:hypothetical protein